MVLTLPPLPVAAEPTPRIDSSPDLLILARDAAPLGQQRIIERAAMRGELVRLVQGAYIRSTHWNSLDEGGRHRMRVHATIAMMRTPLTVSHLSAIAFLEVPIFGTFPERVHALRADAAGGRSTRAVVRHTTSVIPDRVNVEGVVITAPSRTVVDVARSASLANAVTVADAALKMGLITRSDLQLQHELLGSGRGCRQGAFITEFADGASANGGESYARLLMHQAGFTSPLLQAEFVDSYGSMYVDFYWPAAKIAVEFDGFQKYSRSEFLQGRTPAEVVWHEKRREDRLRALGLRVVRIVWSDLITPGALARILSSAGVPRLR